MKPRTSFSAHSGPNMTPLVDVVMVILIFLMLAGGFGGSEHFLAYQSQPNRSVGPASAAGLGPRVEVFVTADNGRFVATVDHRAVASAEALLQELVSLRQKFESNGVGPDQIAVVLSPAGSAPYQHVIAAYQAVGAAGFTRVAFR